MYSFILLLKCSIECCFLNCVIEAANIYFNTFIQQKYVEPFQAIIKMSRWIKQLHWISVPNKQTTYKERESHWQNWKWIANIWISDKSVRDWFQTDWRRARSTLQLHEIPSSYRNNAKEFVILKLSQRHRLSFCEVNWLIDN